MVSENPRAIVRRLRPQPTSRILFARRFPYLLRNQYPANDFGHTSFVPAP